MKRRPTKHTDWCARDHRCGLAEHRSEEIVVDLPGYGRAVLNRVRHEGGAEYAELRMRITLAEAEPAARRQLVNILGDVRKLVTRAAIVGRPRPN